MPYPVPASFELADLDAPEASGLAFSQAEGGLIITSRQYEPSFRGSMTTRPLLPTEYSDLEAFLFEAVQRNRRLDFVHPKHTIPRFYTDATFSALGWNGQANLTSYVDLYTPVFSGLPVGLRLMRGDRVAFTEGTKNQHKIIAADVTVASAISQQISLTSRLPIGVFTSSCIAVFFEPVLRFMIVPDSIGNRIIADEIYPSLSLDFVETLQ